MGTAKELDETAIAALEEAVAAVEAFSGADLRRKRATVAAMDAGVPMSRVAEAIGVTRPTIYRWRQETAVAFDVL